MPYLQACIHEALRFHPAVGMNLPRVVPTEGIDINGTYLPPGTIIGANPWVVNRDQSIFGEDVEAFRPERWLQGDRYFLRVWERRQDVLGEKHQLDGNEQADPDTVPEV
jgi:cytochrome P450